jgi:hypothetical protein
MRLSNRNLNIMETYILANKILLFFLFLVVLYVLSAMIFKFGISCQYKILYGTECRSCGLTRGLSSCMKLDFSQANKFNTQSTFIFVCVICQIIFRFLLIRISKIKLLLKRICIKPILLFDFTTMILILTIDLKCYG